MMNRANKQNGLAAPELELSLPKKITSLWPVIAPLALALIFALVIFTWLGVSYLLPGFVFMHKPGIIGPVTTVTMRGDRAHIFFGTKYIDLLREHKEVGR
jgi:hypothetical protein